MPITLNFARGLAAALLLALSAAAGAGAPTLPAKAAGVTRIGLVMPRVQMAGADAAKSAESVRTIMANYLQGPTIEVALLGSRLPSQYILEARQADCDYVLSASLTHKRGNSGGSAGAAGLLGGVTNYFPSGSTATDYAKQAIVSTVVQSAQDFAANIKARDDMQLGYKLEAIGGGKPLLEASARRRAKADGDDLLTPLVESAAEAVGGALNR